MMTIVNRRRENGWRRMELKYRLVPCEEFTACLMYAVIFPSLYCLGAKAGYMRRAWTQTFEKNIRIPLDDEKVKELEGFC